MDFLAAYMYYFFIFCFYIDYSVFFLYNKSVTIRYSHENQNDFFHLYRTMYELFFRNEGQRHGKKTTISGISKIQY